MLFNLTEYKYNGYMLTLTQNKTKIYKITIFAALFLFANNIFTFFLTPYLLSFGFTKETISLIHSFAPIAVILLPPILGNLADQIGRKTVLNLTLGIFIISQILYLFMFKNTAFLALAIILNNIGYYGHQFTILEKAEDEFNENRNVLTGFFESIKSLGGMLGTVAGTILITIFPIRTSLTISIGILIGLLILTNLHKINFKKVKVVTPNFFEEIKDFWAIKKLRAMAILGFSLNFSAPTATLVIPLLLTTVFNAEIRYIGYYATALLLAHMLQFTFGYSCNLYGTKNIILFSTVTFSLLLGSLFFAVSPLQVILIGFLAGLATSAWNTSAWCYMSEIGEKLNKEGTIVGSYASYAQFGTFVSFISTSIFLRYFPINYIFVLYALVALTGISMAKKYLK